MMDRRRFLGSSLAAAGGVMLGGSKLGALTEAGKAAYKVSGDRLLDHPASESAIDTVVVVMLENRSFDHLLGWLAHDEGYLEEGKRRHGSDFRLIGSTDEHYQDPHGTVHRTIDTLDLGHSGDPYRGCEYAQPGHTWEAARAQLERGFLGRGSDNDEYAISYWNGTQFPHHRTIAEHFTVYDRYHASLLGPTFPNRQYLHSAQSEGRKDDPGPLTTGIYKAETIWDRLAAANVPATYYYTDLPLLRLWGTRMKPYIASLDQYFEQAAAGTLPNVVMVEPSFTGVLRADGHPQGDVRLAVAFFAHVLAALLTSPQWKRSMFILAHDEWGGFYDHVKPPRFADDGASKRLADDFGQGGFRAAAAMVSAHTAPNTVDHTIYDHTSILRFLEWRFLGAPAEGPGRNGSKWWLTKRDRFAHPIGQSLTTKPLNLEVNDLLLSPPAASGVTAPCAPTVQAPSPSSTTSSTTTTTAPAPTPAEDADPFATDPSFDEERARDHPEATHRPWVA